jgi:hypothetical protein
MKMKMKIWKRNSMKILMRNKISHSTKHEAADLDRRCHFCPYYHFAYSEEAEE